MSRMNDLPLLAVETPGPPSLAGGGAGRRVLVVEDEMVVAMDIQDRLEMLGYQVAGHTDSGEESILMTEQTRPDLVLMDIGLRGGVDGIEAAREIRQRFHRPVVFLTAYSEEATLQRAKVVGPFGYFLKPFEDRQLKLAIEMALYKHQAEMEIHRLHQVHEVLTHVNQAIVRSHSREELFRLVCRAMVQQGGFRLAWIGWLDTAPARSGRSPNGASPRTTWRNVFSSRMTIRKGAAPPAWP